jgi:hypothetical protein
MPLPIAAMLPTIVVRREAFERQELLRTEIDARFNLTDAEFRVEGGLIAIGPLPSDEMVGPMLEYFEEKGLTYFDDIFELSGNWPEWLKLFALTT